MQELRPVHTMSDSFKLLADLFLSVRSTLSPLPKIDQTPQDDPIATPPRLLRQTFALSFTNCLWEGKGVRGDWAGWGAIAAPFPALLATSKSSIT